eukprot:scaffold5066_cov403-Prasinococcus_capsulatus_cf.AAC.4
MDRIRSTANNASALVEELNKPGVGDIIPGGWLASGDVIHSLQHHKVAKPRPCRLHGHDLSPQCHAHGPQQRRFGPLTKANNWEVSLGKAFA